MTCRELIDFLGAWLDDELDPPTLTLFDRHLALCPSCVAYLATYRRTIALARDAAADENAAAQIPDELVAAVLAARAR